MSVEEYRFDDYRLLAERPLLMRGDKKVQLRPKPLQILTELVRRRGGAVSKSELYDTIWRDVHVADHTAEVHIAALRKALGPDLIITIPGRGYRVSAAVTRIGEVEIAAAPSGQASSTALSDAVPGALQTNLPHRLGTLFGRAAELTELSDLLEEERLVTLTGPGGVGKTRLAIELGHRLAKRFPGGVWLIDLAPLAEKPDLVASATASVLGVTLDGTRPPAEAIAAAIRPQQMLLIFDNCEYLVGAAAALVTGLLDRAPSLKVLVTSQEALRVPAEQIFRLDPLPLPPAETGDIKTGDILGFGAIDLFVARAQAADRRFRRNVGDPAAIAEICRRLDGLPLALEMAAARLPSLGFEGLRKALDVRLRLLGNRPVNDETRHATLGAMLELSYKRLNSAEQRLFRQLGIFAGSFSLDGAVAVAGEADRWEVADLLVRLIDKSLVVVKGSEEPRYRLLETMRLYAADLLKSGGEQEAVAKRQALHVIDVFGMAHKSWETTPFAVWFDRYRVEIDNLRAALDWALADRARVHTAIWLSMTVGVIRFEHGPIMQAEGRKAVEHADALIAQLPEEEKPPAALQAPFLHMAGIWHFSANPSKALDCCERSARLYREQLGSPPGLGAVLAVTGALYCFSRRYDEAEAVLREAERILSPSLQKKSLCLALRSLAYLAAWHGKIELGRQYLERTMDLAEELDDCQQKHTCLAIEAELAFSQNLIDEAAAKAREAVALLRSDGQRLYLTYAMNSLTAFLIAQENYREAQEFADEALGLLESEGGHGLRTCLQLWALLRAVDGRHDEAALLFGFINAASADAGKFWQPADRHVRDKLGAMLQAALPAADAAAFAAEGARWTERQAVAFVREKFQGLRAAAE